MQKDIIKRVRQLNKLPKSLLQSSNHLEQFNSDLSGYGIEPLRKNGYFHKYYGDVVALFVNMGDSYTETVFFDTKRELFFIGDFEFAAKRFKL